MDLWCGDFPLKAFSTPKISLKRDKCDKAFYRENVSFPKKNYDLISVPHGCVFFWKGSYGFSLYIVRSSSESTPNRDALEVFPPLKLPREKRL